MSEPASITTATGATRANLYPKSEKFPARYDLLMRNSVAMRRMAEVFGEGEAKYGPDNWMKGFEESVLISHAMEHLRQYLAGDTSDDHIAHLTWNMMTLMWIQENKPELVNLTKQAQTL